ncbi:MAG: PP2C family protein-serine/threonine phosphatase [Planctomycetota bacterium]|nr:PP2C family protein-serine/threonine phosphatase [Planctomycetota bacterium]
MRAPPQPMQPSPEPSTSAARSAQPHSLACMEIWGGNERIESGLSTPGLDAWVFSEPFEGESEGGDVHYVSMCNSGNIARFVVADVSGHGAEVGEAARTLRGLVRRNMNTADNTRFTRALNGAFQMESSGGRYATAVLATYFAPTDELLIVNAGHPRPLLYRAAAQRWELLTGDGAGASSSDTNLPLGIIEPTDFSQFAVKLQKGDLVFIYTDGLMEARDGSGNMLGERGMLQLAESLDVSKPGEIIGNLLRRLRDWQQGASLNDDVTCILLHHNASDPPAYSLRAQITALARVIGLIPV